MYVPIFGLNKLPVVMNILSYFEDFMENVGGFLENRSPVFCE
jgi:hypothetical protein